MKTLLIIPLFIAVSLGIAAGALSVTGVRFSPADPLCAGVIAAIAAMLGVAPIIWARPRDQLFAFQLALAGTVLQMLLSLAMGVTVIATRIVPHDGRMGFWLIAGYWASLFVMIGQLRRLVLAAPLAKAEK